MTEKQKQFCLEYLQDFNATQAAIRAGYSKKTARQIGEQNLSKLDIQNYIAELTSDMNEKKIASAEDVLQFFSDVYSGKIKEHVLKYDHQGHQVVVEVEAALKDKLKAAELLGKAHGVFNDKTSANDSIQKVEIVNDLPTD